MTRDEKEYWCHPIVAYYVGDIPNVWNLISIKHEVLAERFWPRCLVAKYKLLSTAKYQARIILMPFQVLPRYSKIAPAVQSIKKQITFIHILVLRYLANSLLLDVIVAKRHTKYSLLNRRTRFILAFQRCWRIILWKDFDNLHLLLNLYSQEWRKEDFIQSGERL